MTLTDTQISQITHRLKERGASEDNIQDTFVKLLQLPQIPQDPIAWACKTALRLAIDETRRGQTRGKLGQALRLTPPATLDHLTPERVTLLREATNGHWKNQINCTHPDRPRYGKKGLNTCYPCYKRAWDQNHPDPRWHKQGVQ